MTVKINVHGFLFFFSLVVVARTSKAILNNGGKESTVDKKK